MKSNTTNKSPDALQGLRSPKEPRSISPEWSAARKACRDSKDGEQLKEELLNQLEEVIRLGWQPHELAEFARIWWHAPGLDHATPSSYRSALQSANTWIGSDFLARFRELGRIPAPPRAKAELYSKNRKEKLAPQFNIEWEGHTDEFREEVAEWARKDRGLAPGDYVGPRWWKIACNRHYELTDS